MTPKVLINLGFTKMLNESANGQTQTGSELLNKYKVYLMTNEESCRIVNNFFNEAQQCRYDSTINHLYEDLADYIAQNKTGWAIATVCENINADETSRNMLNRNAAKQAEKLLEMQEADIERYIRAGALKNVMFCEAFRNIAKSVYKNTAIIETTAQYTKFTPCSLVENVGDGNCFVVAGQLYKVNDDKELVEAKWSEVSDEFKQIEQLMESQLCTIDEDNIFIKYNNTTYTISEANKITKETKSDKRVFTVEEFRDNNRLALMAINNRRRQEAAGILETITKLAEQYDNICNLDNVGIYSTRGDRFMVIENGEDNLFVKLLQSNHSQPWTINENAIKALDYIKQKTNVQLSEAYKANVEKAMDNIDESDKKQIKESLEDNTILSLKERIEVLTEKFKNDPIKLSVLSKLAAEVAEC